MEKDKKPVNDIRISFNSRIGAIVRYCEKLLKEDNMRELNFSAVGGSIGTLVSVVEVVKALNPGLYQVNRLATITYQSVEEGGKTEAQNLKLFPKLEVKLTLDKPQNETEGFQEKLSEENRKKILDIYNKRREQRRRPRIMRARRGNFRRGGFGGRSRGRPIFRGRPMRGGRRAFFRARPGMRRGRGRNY